MGAAASGGALVPTVLDLVRGHPDAPAELVRCATEAARWRLVCRACWLAPDVAIDASLVTLTLREDDTWSAACARCGRQLLVVQRP